MSINYADLTQLTFDELCLVQPDRLFNRRINPKEIAHILKLQKAFWWRNDDPKAPHAIMTSGNHTTGYVNCSAALYLTNINELFASQLVLLIRSIYAGPIDVVVGSDHAAATFSYEVGKRLGAKHDFTRKGPDDSQLWERHTIDPDEVVLIAEDLLSTHKTVTAVYEGIRAHHEYPITFAPFIAAFVNRSGEIRFKGKPITALANYDMPVWDPRKQKCEPCEQGSPALRPKETWDQFVACCAI